MRRFIPISKGLSRRISGNFLGSYGNLARMIHSDKSADAMIKASESLANKQRVSTDDLGEYFTNPNGFVSDLGQLGGSIASIIPFAGLVPGGLIARGTAALGGDAITQALINRGMYNAARIFAGGAPQAIRYGIGAGTAESAMEGGETRGNLLARGASEDEATRASLVTAGKNLPLLLATNTLEGLAFFSPLRKANKLLQIGGRAALNSAQEQYEEFAQEGIQNAALGEPYSWLPWNGAPNQYEAAEQVRWPAALLGDLGGAANALSDTKSSDKNTDRQPRGGNIFGTKNYDMPREQMESSVEGLKPGWSDVLPQIGGVLKSMGFDPVLTSAARTREHQMRINPSAPNSYHVIQGDGGDAVDISLSEGELTPEQEQQVLDYFKSTGLFEEVLYHSVVGRKHLHLGGLKTENLNRDLNSPQESPQENSYDPNFNELQNEMWQLAQYASKRLREKHNIRLAPELIYRQWAVESYQTFDSELARTQNNFGGLKDTRGNWRAFTDKQEFADAYVDDFMDLRPEINDVTDENGMTDEKSFSDVMLQTGYIGEGDYNTYVSDLANGSVPKTGYRSSAGNKRAPSAKTGDSSQSQNQPSQSPQEEPSKPLFDLNAQDSTTQKLLEKFVNQKFSKAL